MMRMLVVTGMLALVCGPAAAEQSQARFTQGVQICHDFGSDAFFVQDRLEEQGWVANFSDYYSATILYSPGRTVWVIPPAEEAKMPVTCTVISGSVSIFQAEASVQMTVSNSNKKYQLLSHQGCSEFDFNGATKIRIWSDGQDHFCNDPNSAKVEVITYRNPVAGQ
ncbi:hypothetical protein [Cohaesibacter gelatinilyticus]|uniref:Uncharacterized protein n=1 Tax=Cohaesibacter gelatinilyticus TaxID=372072 RepID=A0A285PBU2_9HYPH|nr:hypothetical protein [Cohaesibacter gelatinilyticus]SNZ19202.1 hypothetical protein SAMN06265368_2282 [Cohaesibacter gelatinilyticus]